jgi:hypothetical protein
MIMSSRSKFDQDIINRVEELDNIDDMLCIGLTSLSSYSSAARASMLTQHLVQALVLDKPEIPAVMTGYEHLFGEFSTSYKRADNKLKIIDKIEKYPGYSYVLLVYDKTSNIYDVIERKEVKNMAESYGFKYNNDVIDNFAVKDTIKKNTILYKSPCMDDNGNYMYGMNGKVIYVVSQDTIEDAVVVSESFAKKMSTTKIIDCMVPFNDNDIPLNLYGSKKEYKSFPDIGDKTKKCILCATRRKNKMMDQLNLKNCNLRKVFSNDDVFQLAGNYQVVDINIWSNKPIDEISDLPTYSQVRKYLKSSIDYWQNIYDKFGEIINNTEGIGYSKELSRLYAKAKDYLDPNCRYIEDDKMFSNIIMEFTLAKSEPLRVGCKLCGRFGNKSVISKILPDSEMGVTKDGIIPDIRMDALGVLGRLNSGQCFEQELNWIADKVKKKMKETDDLQERLGILLNFVERINKDEYTQLVDYLDNLTDSGTENFIQEILDDRIYIVQGPLNSISGDDLYNLYAEFGPEMTSIYYSDGDNKYEALRKVIVADEYILRLKQESISKFSVRSKSLINPRSFMPIKSTKANTHKAIYPDQCNRIGEQELTVLMLSNDMDALDYYYRTHSTSISGRRSETLYTEDPDGGFTINMQSENSIAVSMFDSYMKAMGYNFNIDYEDLPNDDNDEIETVKIPKYIQNLFDK